MNDNGPGPGAMIAWGVGILLACLVVGVAIWGLAFGFRWFTAGPKGQLEAREQILSGENRIAAYNHFFNVCADVRTDEDRLDAFIAERASYAPGTDDYTRTSINITGVQSARAQAINQYNADASKDYTIGQFRDLDLPFQLHDEAYVAGKEHTRCNFGSQS